MNRNPLIPFALIAMLGIAVIIGLSFNGLDNMKEMADAENGHAEEPKEVVTDPEAIYQGKCSACHGGNLEGLVGPGLTDVGAAYTKEEIKDIIVNGLGTSMPGGLVNAEQAEILAQWLSEKK